MWLSQEANHKIGKRGIMKKSYNMLLSDTYTQLQNPENIFQPFSYIYFYFLVYLV